MRIHERRNEVKKVENQWAKGLRYHTHFQSDSKIPSYYLKRKLHVEICKTLYYIIITLLDTNLEHQLR